ncbi:MAG: mevalonate kinase [Desulfurococcales archaeon ex4484_204]|nr:MAG: mevalonate kinase [Desulfurococcales archaeon ex4484_204]
MVRVTASAPGKVTLFGEHAIVYGFPAIVTAIDRRVYVTATARSDRAVRIKALDLRVPGVVVTYTPEEVVIETDYDRTLSAIAYLKKAVEVASRYIGVWRGVNIEVRSSMPVGAGLGTSAAVSVATIAAYSAAVEADLSREEIARLGWEVEKAVQGIASPMDTSIATFGGFIKIWAEGGGKFVRRELKVGSEMPFVIGYVEREAGTKDLVRAVRDLKRRYPDLVNAIMEAIGRVTKEAEEALAREDLRRVGELMNLNHGLLEALGVSNKKLSEMVYAARSAGALGAKLTGAGGGGCAIALTPEAQDRVEVAMRLYASITMKAKFGAPGVEVRVHRA